MEIKVQRKWYTLTSTIGELSIDGRFECYTLEDVVRPAGQKVPGKTAIPAGLYRVVVDYSERFHRYMPHIMDVPMFSGVRIHSGNVAADTEGCILLGKERGTNCVQMSRAAFADFLPKISRDTGQLSDVIGTNVLIIGQATTIEIKDDAAALEAELHELAGAAQ